MAAGDSLRDSLAWHRRCADELAALEAAAVGGAWTTWSPTFGGGGSMTFGSVAVDYAKYRIVGKTVHFQLSATGTTGGTANQNISFTFPVTASNAAAMTCAAWVSDGGDPIGATGRASSTTTCYVAKYDYSNWGLGASRRINVSGSYEAA